MERGREDIAGLCQLGTGESIAPGYSVCRLLCHPLLLSACLLSENHVPQASVDLNVLQALSNLILPTTL